MDRKQFLRNTCKLGICSCVGIGLSTKESFAKENNESDWKERFIKHRFAKLVEILDTTLDENIKIQIIENLGKECSRNGFAKDFKNNVNGFFEEIQSRWGENTTYDEENGIIRIETPERDCVCPFVDSKIISESVCHCSVGWQTQTYNTILGEKVEAKCLESVVRGSKRCVFEIKIIES